MWQERKHNTEGSEAASDSVGIEITWLKSNIYEMLAMLS